MRRWCTALLGVDTSGPEYSARREVAGPQLGASGGSWCRALSGVAAMSESELSVGRHGCRPQLAAASGCCHETSPALLSGVALSAAPAARAAGRGRLPLPGAAAERFQGCRAHLTQSTVRAGTAHLTESSALAGTLVMGPGHPLLRCDDVQQPADFQLHLSQTGAARSCDQADLQQIRVSVRGSRQECHICRTAMLLCLKDTKLHSEPAGEPEDFRYNSARGCQWH